MKQTIALTITLLAFAASAIDLIVPKVDDRTILRSPLDEGRVAYQALDDGNASLLIGKKDDAHPYRVVDPLTIRGYKIFEIPEEEYSVTYTGGFTYNGTDNKYVLNNTLNVTNRIVFTALGNRKITSFDAYEKNKSSAGAVGDMPCAKVERVVTDKQVIITVYKFVAGDYYLQDPIVYGSDEGSELGHTDLVNDLHVRVTDTIGDSDLSTWRYWAKHSNDGNLGVDWYKYEANGTVVMNARDDGSNTITNRYDSSNHGYSFNGIGTLKNYYKLYYDRVTTNLVLKAGQYYPIEVQARGFGAPADFRFTKIEKTNEAGVTNVELVVQVPDPNYNVNLVSIYHVDSLTNKTGGVINWQLLPSGKITKSGVNFVCNLSGIAGADKAQFFRFVYGGVDMASCVTFLREDVLMEDDAQINGNLGVVSNVTVSTAGNLSVLKPHGLRVVGDDAITYELHINGGTATWTPVP